MPAYHVTPAPLLYIEAVHSILIHLGDLGKKKLIVVSEVVQQDTGSLFSTTINGFLRQSYFIKKLAEFFLVTVLITTYHT